MSNRTIIWMTGLSGAGKTTLAKGLLNLYNSNDISATILDGDNLRNGINSDLGFEKKDRVENIRRVTEIAKLFSLADVIPIISLISPYLTERENVRKQFEHFHFLEVYIKCSIEKCEERDPKGLYRKVRLNQISNFTGISDIYEPPINPDIVIDTENDSYESCLMKLWQIANNKFGEAKTKINS